ncbi:MAG: copper amine oxidase N-terminal domain-containing protein [Clostridia bacterium]|nr:copper amine oxidase N-terminal domain-containing protein [Clostridia bacterium]
MKKQFAGLLCGVMLFTFSAFAAGNYSVTVDGKTLDLGSAAPYEEGGHVMLPLRKVAEALGFVVTWEQETHKATVDDGLVKSSVTIGVDGYYMADSQTVGATAPQSFGVAPVLVSDTTFVPSDLFTLLCGQSSVKDGVVALKKNSQTQIPNPMKQYATLDEALAVLDFQPGIPTALPTGFERSAVWVIDATLLDVRYHSGDKEILFRAAKGTDDVSGDYNEWDSTIIQPEGKTNYTLKGNGDTVSLVVWNDGVISYSLSFLPGVSVETAVNTAKGVAQK